MLYGYRMAALCVSRIHEQVLLDFVSAFSETLAAHGWRLFVFTTGTDLFWRTKSNQGEEAVFDLIDPDVIDALVVFRDKVLDDECLRHIIGRAREHQIPVYHLNGIREDCCNLMFDYEGGFASVVEHLIDVHGVTDFHMIAGMRDNEFSDTRIAVMQKLLRERGIPFDESRVSYGDFWSVPAREAVRKLIEEDRLPRAIVCANDTMAIAVCVELHKHGYNIPEDVIVTGFDGIDAIQFSIPKITSAKCDYAELGTKLAELVAEGNDTPRTVLLLPKLILQESCGCVSRSSIDMVDFINNLNDTFNRFQTEEEMLGEISSRIQGCQTLKEVTEQLHHEVFYSMTVLLKEECIDFSLDPLEKHSTTTFGERLYIAADTDAPGSDGNMIPLKTMVPRMENMLRSSAPLIFIALHQIDIPLGFICFHFQQLDRQPYLKINQIAMSVSSAVAGFRNAQYQRRLQAVVEEMYKYDALTGLYHRNAFLKQYRRMQEDQHIDAMTLVLCDVDGLKYINDHFSHKEGDNAIAVTANALHTVCRDGLCCRYGGDELIALLPEAGDPVEIRREILDRLSMYNSRSRKPYDVSASIGVYTSSGETVEQMLEKADVLMYQDKLGKPHRRQ